MENKEVKELITEINNFLENDFVLFDKIKKEEIKEIFKAINKLENDLFNMQEHLERKELINSQNELEL